MTICEKIQILTRAMSISGIHSESKRDNISVDEVITNYKKLRNALTEDNSTADEDHTSYE